MTSEQTGQPRGGRRSDSGLGTPVPSVSRGPIWVSDGAQPRLVCALSRAAAKGQPGRASALPPDL